MKLKTQLAVLFFLAACVNAPPTATTSQGVLTLDDFQPPLFLAHREEARNLGQVRLAEGPALSALMATREGQLVLSFLISCALPGDLTLVTHDENGLEFDFPGEIGLAKHWGERPLQFEEQREVSPCLFARLNAADVEIPISLRGVHLVTSIGERDGWTLQEGAFWGNVFTDQLEWFACRGTAPASLDRECTEEDPAVPGVTKCGLVYGGICADVCTDNGRGVYRTCNDAHQVITTFLLAE